MKRFLKQIHRYLYIGSVVFFFILYYPFLYYYSRKRERFTGLNKVRRSLGFVTSAAVGFFYRFSFEKPIDWSGKFIICANHSSILDITAITLMVRSNFAFLGKEELLNNPVTGLFFKTVDIPLNRESKMSSFRAFKRADEYIRNGMSLVIFPEGKIPDTYPPQLSTFKNGPFKLAIEHQIPIIPVSITNAWEKMWDDGSEYGSRPGICHICVHSQIETAGLTVDDADLLGRKVHDIIKGRLEKNET
ncbi:1-acyl-sn-glycerol-3-phosphate acyltransferase [Arcticibacter tournemirensis]|uniref:1-acyl-sn-glycerol-3-phosphate acyltransferase n=1 Tax=Arcticibacter tournemirensis TaxID=699437 RepID=A0A5M9HE79_9SPHI|nr:lysophospholipid acyltransferase family protein [Arcticibacter tournemirensis]KAA8483634.1 1-acyl-sn-glycerol-3-phosphate acyltransferase [Arcticibacter tournemirensis]TQM51411.1 1-acyl-sn-glycerol-3-phosphate acyltransferase [Arcticibacter tournemirensis]